MIVGVERATLDRGAVNVGVERDELVRGAAIIGERELELLLREKLGIARDWLNIGAVLR